MHKNPLIAAILALLIGTLACAQISRIDETPKYGGIDRSTYPDLKAADEKFIADVVSHYGSREKAAAAFVEQGFRFNVRDKLGMAMRRFNQAWLLDPNNPEVYWGFGSVLHDQEKMCEAMKYFETALGFGRYISGMYPDAGRVISLCAAEDGQLNTEERKRLYARADALYTEAAEKDRNKGYVYASWASAYFWRGQYADSWAMVKKARNHGGHLPAQFLSMLRAKMAEP